MDSYWILTVNNSVTIQWFGFLAGTTLTTGYLPTTFKHKARISFSVQTNDEDTNSLVCCTYRGILSSLSTYKGFGLWMTPDQRGTADFLVHGLAIGY